MPPSKLAVNDKAKQALVGPVVFESLLLRVSKPPIELTDIVLKSNKASDKSTVDLRRSLGSDPATDWLDRLYENQGAKVQSEPERCQPQRRGPTSVDKLSISWSFRHSSLADIQIQFFCCRLFLRPLQCIACHRALDIFRQVITAPNLTDGKRTVYQDALQVTRIGQCEQRPRMR